jgi:hypothetical protein
MGATSTYRPLRRKSFDLPLPLCSVKGKTAGPKGRGKIYRRAMTCRAEFLPTRSVSEVDPRRPHRSRFGLGYENKKSRRRSLSSSSAADIRNPDGIATSGVAGRLARIGRASAQAVFVDPGQPDLFGPSAENCRRFQGLSGADAIIPASSAGGIYRVSDFFARNSCRSTC